MKNRKLILFMTIVAIVLILIVFGVARFINVGAIKEQLMELDLQEEKLEMDYMKGTISSDDYMKKKADLERQEHKLEAKEDLWSLDFD